MPSSGMSHYVVLVITEVLEEHTASIIRVTRNGKLGTTLTVTTIVILCSLLWLLVTVNVVPSIMILCKI
jgi:hypothetical protein